MVSIRLIKMRISTTFANLGFKSGGLKYVQILQCSQVVPYFPIFTFRKQSLH